jgi:hypothetical protein
MSGSIHIKIDYANAVSQKKNTLIIEKSLLEIIQHTRNYNLLRKQEFLLKLQIKKAMFEIESLIKEIEPSLPTEELKQARLMGKHERGEKPATTKATPKKTIKVSMPKTDLDAQIQEIQAKLASLG